MLPACSHIGGREHMLEFRCDLTVRRNLKYYVTCLRESDVVNSNNAFYRSSEIVNRNKAVLLLYRMLAFSGAAFMCTMSW